MSSVSIKRMNFKRGTTFKVWIVFEADEWPAVYPWTSIAAEVGQGSRRYPLTVESDPSTRTITLNATPAETATWLSYETGGTSAASFDVKLVRNGETLKIPASFNMPMNIIEGVTR